MRLEFREVLRGFFGPGASAAEGYRRGREAGSAFALEAKAIIEDLDAFESDPEHRARLEGEVDWLPAGCDLRLVAGEVRLFVPRAWGRALAYELSFRASGRSFELKGEKRLRRWPTFGDLTTLYANLFAEGDPEPVARGILRVPVAEALRFGLGVRVPGKGFIGSLGTTSRFLRFSQRQLLAPLPPRS